MNNMKTSFGMFNEGVSSTQAGDYSSLSLSSTCNSDIHDGITAWFQNCSSMKSI